MEQNSVRSEEEACPNENNFKTRPDLSRRHPDRDRLLLEIAELVVGSRSLPKLFEELAPRILTMTSRDFLKFSLHDPRQSCMITHFWNKNHESGALDAFAVDQCVSGWVWTHQETIFLSDVEKEKRFPFCIQELRKHGIRSYMVLPLTVGARRFGALGFGITTDEVPDSSDSEFFHRVASMVALALKNHEAHRLEQEQRERLQGLVAIGRDLNARLDMECLSQNILDILRITIPHDNSAVMVLEDEGRNLRWYAADPATREIYGSSSDRLPVNQTLLARAIETRSAVLWSPEELAAVEMPVGKTLRSAGIQSVVNIPLLAGENVWGVLNLDSRQRNSFSPVDIKYLQQVADQIGAALRNVKAYREIAQLKDRLLSEKRHLESEIRSEMRCDEIVGRSPALKRVLEYASIVATTDSSVLITGETGTGKERVARVIHSLSRRRDRNFIKLNCAAIPTGLLESELFGHEKGAFTGAVSQKIGRLELADKGTLFLDEIGEIAVELQPKLLRVLQDQEFERLGGTRTIRVDARLISATNRDLARAVEEKQFRSDLFYRLHVFPLHLPALRDRLEDIPALVHHFVEKSSAKLGRRIESIPHEAMEAIMQWNWPGNIRELENFIERSVILSDGSVLRAPLSELRQEIARQQSDGTLHDREREHIIDVLNQSRGILSGPRGAAARLGLKRTTLQYKLQKLGISRKEYLD
jgi:formate hydrogenlyase transcriptional activator